MWVKGIHYGRFLFVNRFWEFWAEWMGSGRKGGRENGAAEKLRLLLIRYLQYDFVWQSCGISLFKHHKYSFEKYVCSGSMKSIFSRRFSFVRQEGQWWSLIWVRKTSHMMWLYVLVTIHSRSFNLNRYYVPFIQAVMFLTMLYIKRKKLRTKTCNILEHNEKKQLCTTIPLLRYSTLKIIWSSCLHVAIICDVTYEYQIKTGFVVAFFF